MGVIYKLKEEVVGYIISQRQGNPLSSCRQLAEDVFLKYGLRLSKSSVHDVLKEFGIATPRGRKPKDKFQIPLEKKQQIQTNLSKIKLLPAPELTVAEPAVAHLEEQTPIPLPGPVSDQPQEPLSQSQPQVLPEEVPSLQKDVLQEPDTQAPTFLPLPIIKQPDEPLPLIPEFTSSPEYEGAGKIFFKAALWDLGLFTDGNIKEADRAYYLTYCKGIKVELEDGRNFLIEMPVPLERGIREAVDGLFNNIRPFLVKKVSDEELFKAVMEGQAGTKMASFSIVDGKDRIILELGDIVEHKREFVLKNITYMESNEFEILARTKQLFFSHNPNSTIINNLDNIWGIERINKDSIAVTLITENGYSQLEDLEAGALQLNNMFLRDAESRLLTVEIRSET